MSRADALARPARARLSLANALTASTRSWTPGGKVLDICRDLTVPTAATHFYFSGTYLYSPSSAPH